MVDQMSLAMKGLAEKLKQELLKKQTTEIEEKIRETYMQIEAEKEVTLQERFEPVMKQMTRLEYRT